jgi:serine/threonine protein kinase/WD40 repeat protein
MRHDPLLEFDPEPLVSRLVAYDGLLAAGKTPAAAKDESSIDGESDERLEKLQALLDLIEEHWPRAAPRVKGPARSEDEAGEAGDPQDAPLASTPHVQAGIDTVVENGDAIVGRFRLLHELGCGGFGVVYLAYDPKLKRQVALKLPRPEVLLAEGLRKRFLREARATASLDHPHIVPVFETGEIGGACYLVSAYCKGGTLAQDLAQRQSPLDAREAAHLAILLADAVEYAHSRGVLHRDLKPGNVLLDDAPSNGKAHDAHDLNASLREHGLTPRLADFGLAKFLPGAKEFDEEDSDRKSPSSAMPATQTGAMLGTPRYMAPEQVEGRLEAIGRVTDVYGLGGILYETLTGKPAFAASGLVELIRQVLDEDPSPLRRLRSEVPRDLEAICLKCLEKRPERRYATAANLRADLERFLRGEATIARPLSPVQRAARWVGRRPMLTALIATLVLASVGLLAGVSIYTVRLNAHRAALEKSQKQAAEQAKDADEHKRFGEERDFFARQQNYRQEMVYAAGLWKSKQLGELSTSLDRLQPQAGQKDVRGFEWHYLNSLAWKLTPLSGHEGKVKGVRFSRDGRYCASWDEHSVIRIWRVPSGSLNASLACSGLPFAVTFSEDSRRLIAIHSEGIIEAWDALTGRSLTKRQGPKLQPRQELTAYSSAAFSPDGREFAYTVPTQSKEELRVDGVPSRLRIDPSVALNELGAFVLAWSCAGENDSTGILARHYDESGAQASEIIEVNDTMEGNQFWPSAAINSKGEFVVAYSSESEGAAAWDVLAQRFNAKGERQGEEFRVNHHTPGSQCGSFAALDDNGNLVITWHGQQDEGAGYDIFARCFDRDGKPQGEEFVVNRNTHGEQTWPTIEIESNGDYQITWNSSIPAESGVSVYAQSYRASGERVGEETLVRRVKKPGGRQAFVTMNESGKLTIVWKARSSESGEFDPSQLPLRSGVPDQFETTLPRGEFQVNTSTTGRQTQFKGSKRAVAMNRAGDAVIVWSSLGQNGTSWTVFAQRYDAYGMPHGGEFHASSNATGSQKAPQAAIDDAGNVVIVWTRCDVDGSNHQIIARRFDAQGVPIGDEFRVDAELDPLGTDPQVSMVRDGSFLIAWRHRRNNETAEDIFAQWHDPQGRPRGGRISVCTEPGGLLRGPALATSDSGEAVLAWSVAAVDDLYVQRLSPTGELLGPKLCVSAESGPSHDYPSVAMDAQGNFLIVWQTSKDRDGSGWGVFARRYTAQGEPLGPEFIVNTRRSNNQLFSSAAMNRNGEFLITWQSAKQDGSGEGIFAQRFDRHGLPVGGEFQVNEHNTGDQRYPNVTLNEAGRQLISWTSAGQDGDEEGVFARWGEFATELSPTTDQRAAPKTPRTRWNYAKNRSGVLVIAWSDINSDGSESNIFAQRFDAEGNALGQGKWAHRLFLADVKTGETRELPELKNRWISEVSFSPDKTKLAVGLHSSQRQPCGFQILDIESGSLLKRLPYNEPLCGPPCFSQDGEQVAFGSHDSHGVVWNWKTEQLVKEPLGGPSLEVYVALAHHRELMASGGIDRQFPFDDEQVRIWDLRSKEKVAELPRFQAAIEDLEFSSDD